MFPLTFLKLGEGNIPGPLSYKDRTSYFLQKNGMLFIQSVFKGNIEWEFCIVFCACKKHRSHDYISQYTVTPATITATVSLFLKLLSASFSLVGALRCFVFLFQGGYIILSEVIS